MARDNDVIKAFAAHLARITDKDERERALSQAKMLAMQEAPEEAFEAPIVDLGTYLDTPIQIPPALVGPTIVVRGELTTTLGRAGKGKTTFNIHRILRWAAGLPLFDDFLDRDGIAYLTPCQPLRTLIIENEGNAGMFHQRMGMRLYNSGDTFTDDDRRQIRENVLIWGDGGYSGLKLDRDEGVDLVSRGLEKHRPDIVFIEPFRGLWRGEENSATDMANVVDNIIGMATAYNCGVILSHHERKSGVGEDGEKMSAGRGSTVLEGAAAVMENFQVTEGGLRREISWSKNRYLPPPPPTLLDYDEASGLYRHVPEGDTETRVLEVLAPTAQGEEPWSRKAICELTGISDGRIKRALETLHRAGRVTVGQSKQLPGGGTTGLQYRLPFADNGAGGGLAI